MVSIIVPVYNTEKYLNKCIHSILHQTYTDLEIIFINDGSTDHSLQILEKYQAQDDRIQIVSIENGGQGRARNIGIKQATGKFIMFVDSDDWISERCVEMLYYPMINLQCDIVIGDVVQTQLESEDVQFVFEQDLDDVIVKDNKKKKLFKIQVFPFAKLYRKSLFIEHDLFFPECFFEDVATIPLLCIVANKIYYQHEIVYYYRCRIGSTVRNVASIYDRIQCLSILEKRLQQMELYDEYKEVFTAYALQRSVANRLKGKELLGKCYHDFERRQLIFDYQHFGEIRDFKLNTAYVYGSYNLMIAVKIFLRLKDEESVPNYFGFQNIISCMSPSKGILNTFSISHQNAFRKKMLSQDFEKSFLSLDPKWFETIGYFVLDFLEERYDTGYIDGECFTLSDAFQDMDKPFQLNFVTLKSFSPEWEHVWHEKCDLFIHYLKSLIHEEKIILVKMKLAEKYVENGYEYFFPNIKAIRDINDQLEECYRYFQRQCPKALVINVTNLESYHSDKVFRHGCFPWHLNDACYRNIAIEIKKKTNRQKYEDMLLEERQKAKGR